MILAHAVPPFTARGLLGCTDEETDWRRKWEHLKHEDSTRVARWAYTLQCIWGICPGPCSNPFKKMSSSKWYKDSRFFVFRCSKLWELLWKNFRSLVYFHTSYCITKQQSSNITHTLYSVNSAIWKYVYVYLLSKLLQVHRTLSNKCFLLTHPCRCYFCDFFYNIWLKMEAADSSELWYDIYLLTAVGLIPGGSSTVHIYTQTIHRTT
jgi:hypothetical protein